MSFVGSNRELVNDYTASHTGRKDVLFFFGRPTSQASLVLRHMPEFKKLVYDLAVRGYICQNAKMNGDSGVHPAILRVMEQTGFTETDMRPASVSGLLTALFRITTLPYKHDVVQAPDRYKYRFEGTGFVDAGQQWIDQDIIYIDVEK